jgi:hypothetical protein
MSTKTTQIEATLDIVIEHYRGPKIEDADHVRRWICAVGQRFAGMHGAICFQVCPDHANPDECGMDCHGDISTYKATVVSANWED